jgi:hypothetical protein
MRNKMIGSVVLVGMFLLFSTSVVQAQEVKVILHKSTYGIDGNVLTKIANDLIDKKLADLKAVSGRVLANIEIVDEDHEKYAVNFHMTVTFQLKETYTAKVKHIHFSLVQGKLKDVAIADPKPVKIRLEKKKRVFKDHKTKHKIHISPDGTLRMKSIKPEKIKKKSKPEESTGDSWTYVKGLADTPCSYYPSAKQATETINSMFCQAFNGSCAQLMDGQDTIGALRDYLQYDSSLIAWNHIGHGSAGGIQMWDGMFTDQMISDMDPYRGVESAVILLNSCLTCLSNDPRCSRVMPAYCGNSRDAWLSKNPRTFIAGNILLPIGKSEQVDICFWQGVLFNHQRMDDTLTSCCAAQGLQGAFCLYNDGGLFW